MKPGDLVRVIYPCIGSRRDYREGELGFVTHTVKSYLSNDRSNMHNVLFTDGTEAFADTMLEVVNAEG